MYKQQFRFLKWDVYKDAKGLLSLIFETVKRLPKEYKFTLGSQIIRAAFSIVLNIAEGSGKDSEKELNRYFEISLGSVYEVLAAVDCLKDNNLITQEEFDLFLNKLKKIADQIGGFKKSLKSP